MRYVIDYRNGSMGHTILSHALFACNKIKIDIDQIFSTNGNTHIISNLNNTNLICNHNLEYPLQDPSLQIISVVCTGWDEVIRKIMAYCKHYRMYPTEDNLDKFEFKIIPGVNPLEYLSITYFDSYDITYPCNSKVLHLGQYLEHQLNCLQEQVENILGWQWDQDLSMQFHNRMLVHNQQYIQWQQLIKTIVCQTLEKNVVQCNLQFWEKAIVISMACKQKKVNPIMLHWDECNFLDNNNHSLIESLHECITATT